MSKAIAAAIQNEGIDLESAGDGKYIEKDASGNEYVRWRPSDKAAKVALHTLQQMGLNKGLYVVCNALRASSLSNAITLSRKYFNTVYLWHAVNYKGEEGENRTFYAQCDPHRCGMLRIPGTKTRLLFTRIPVEEPSRVDELRRAFSSEEEGYKGVMEWVYN